MDPSKREADAIDREESDSVRIVRSATDELAVANVQNNLMYNNVNKSSINYNINNTQAFHMGNVFNIGVNVGQVGKPSEMSRVHMPQKAVAYAQTSTATTDAALQLQQQLTTKCEDETGYKKTPTIAKMMRSKDRLYDGYLDYICGKFGHRWRDLTILLGIDQLFVERMKEDYFVKGGTKEVVYQCITHYFRENDKKKVEGWFIEFLWKNSFKSTVWAVKDKYNDFKALEQDLDLYIENNEAT